jgi:hypothetical protein
MNHQPRQPDRRGRVRQIVYRWVSDVTDMPTGKPLCAVVVEAITETFTDELMADWEGPTWD